MDKTVRDEWVRLIFLGAIFDWNYFTNAGLTHDRIQELAERLKPKHFHKVLALAFVLR